MAYVFKAPANVRIQLPKRSWNSGLGQAWLNSGFCNLFGLTTGWCAQYAPTAPAALPAPAAPQTIQQMTDPADWSPEISEIATQQQASTDAQDFFAGLPSTSCDSTAVVWTDPTTYCPSSWGLVALVAVGVVVAAVAVKKGKR